MEDEGAGRVQHLTKASSDELLSKFAEVVEEQEEEEEGDKSLVVSKRKELRFSSTKRQKRSRTDLYSGDCDSPSFNSGGINKSNNCLAERKSLLPPAATRRSAALIRHLKIGGRAAKLRARNLRNKPLFGTIEKTWRKTVEGASKVFIEKHYNRHKRLINDIA